MCPQADAVGQPEPDVTIGSKVEGYPCPKDGATLTLVKGGAWCPECQTVWRELSEVPLDDLDALPIVKHEHRWSRPFRSMNVGLNDPLVRRCQDCDYVEHLDG